MKYPVIKKRCSLDHVPVDSDMCGDCRRRWETLCEEFENKYEIVKVRVFCQNCHGTGFYSSTYGQSPCEHCKNGYNWIEKWKHIEKSENA